MIRPALAFAIVAALAKSVVPVPSISYFTEVRDIRISQPGAQNYFAVDSEIWSHARPNLGDLRIYDGQNQVQYALRVEARSTSSQETAAKILNLGSKGGHTEFDLDMGQIAEYDRIRLNLDAKDFVVAAAAEGRNELEDRAAVKLPSSTLYDFTREALGNNSVLKLPASSFRYLHVSLSPGISPEQVKGAAIYNLQETKAIRTSVGSCGAATQEQRRTIITCESPAKVPLDRFRFEVNSGQVNFRRTITITNSNGGYEGSGEITRVRLNRGSTSVVSEDLDVPLTGQASGRITVAVDNGDNPPLAISEVQLLSTERRVYFDPSQRTALKLYYGDDKLEPPQYDYARFFHTDPDAVEAELGPASHNEAYRGRPDDRPWSERHNTILWLAMLAAAAVLAVLAIRGLKTKAMSS